MKSLIRSLLYKQIAIPKVNFPFLLYKFSCLALFLSSFYFKFLWNYSNSSILLIFNIIAFFFYLMTGGTLKKIPLEQLFLITTVVILQVISNKFEGAVGQIITIVSLVFFLLVADDRKQKIFKFIVDIYTVIMLVSLIGWFMVIVFRLPLPMHETQFQHYRFYDYGIMNIRIDTLSFSRYLGMFIEPGYTGVMTVLILIANGFDLKKKQNCILLICAIMTLSLAAMLLLGIYIFLMIPMSKKAKITIIIVAIIFVLLFIYSYSNKESFIWYFIFRRFEDLLSGNITGNRFSDRFDIFYDKEINSSLKNYFFGVGSVYYDTLKLSSCGYRVYIAQFGIINSILVVLFYLSNNLRNLTKRNLIFFIVWFASFIDLGYPTWLCFIIIYVSGSINLKNLEIKNDKHFDFLI